MFLKRFVLNLKILKDQLRLSEWAERLRAGTKLLSLLSLSLIILKKCLPADGFTIGIDPRGCMFDILY